MIVARLDAATTSSPARRRRRRARARCCPTPTSSSAARRAPSSSTAWRPSRSRRSTEIWQNRSSDLPLKTPPELVTSPRSSRRRPGKADERPRVAGVFINRLQQAHAAAVRPDDHLRPRRRQGHARPADHCKAELDQRDALQHLCRRRACRRGRSPIPAAPRWRRSPIRSRTKDLYFVADGTGGHAFAETLEQHNRNVARWRADRAQQRDAGRATPRRPGDRRPSHAATRRRPRRAATATPGKKQEARLRRPGRRTPSGTRSSTRPSISTRRRPCRRSTEASHLEPRSLARLWSAVPA